jgi:hypothetical protein
MIEPIFNNEEISNSKRVGLKDFHFVKCIGVGGFSRVYLVR